MIGSLSWRQQQMYRNIWAAMLIAMNVSVMPRAAAQSFHTVSVKDLLAMKEVGDPADGLYADQVQTVGFDPSFGQHWVEFSPDGQHAAMIVTWADRRSDTIRAEVRIYDTSSLKAVTAPPAIVATRSSDSNSPPIQRLMWLSDNRQIVYLGTSLSGLSQIYETNITSKLTRQLTHSAEPIASYAITPDGHRLVFLARNESSRVVSKDSATAVPERPYFVADPNLTDIVTHSSLLDYDLQTSHLFVQSIGRSTAKEIPDPGLAPLLGHTPLEFRIGRCNPLQGGVSISPDGRYAVRTCTLVSVPRRWRRYMITPQRPAESHELYRPALAEALHRSPNDQTAQPAGMFDAYLMQHIVFDLTTGRSYVAIDSPLTIANFGVSEGRSWLPSGHTMFVSNTWLPPEAQLPALSNPLTTPPLVEVNVSTGKTRLVAILRAPPRMLKWDFVRHGLAVDFNGRDEYGVSGLESSTFKRPLFFAYERGQLRLRSDTKTVGKNSNGNIRMFVHESLSQPPEIMADEFGGRAVAVADVDAFLRDRLIGDIRQFEWSAGKITWVGAIYYPPKYRSGMRYPLVIQTHGYSPQRFKLDGDTTTGMAAEPLAASGILVVQIGSYFDQPHSDRMAALPTLKDSQRRLEALIDTLDKRGLIIRSKVGITAFSSTCFGVEYFLTHSNYSVAASIIGDGATGGYWQYVMVASDQGYSEMQGAIGSAPFGLGLKNWLERDPGFVLDRIRTPMRIEANGLIGLMPQWQLYAELSALGKPVELLYHPSGSHDEVRPLDRYESEHGAVDWYRFWLQGVIPTDPQEAKRLEALRAAQAASLREVRPRLLLWNATPQ